MVIDPSDARRRFLRVPFFTGLVSNQDHSAIFIITRRQQKLLGRSRRWDPLVLKSMSDCKTDSLFQKPYAQTGFCPIFAPVVPT